MRLLHSRLLGISPHSQARDPVRGDQAVADDPVDGFFAALRGHDVEALRACLHPDFEMVVPQRPARGFKGREQEISNMLFLFRAYPDFSVTVLRKAVDENEVWTETTAAATGLEMAAVVIWTVDPGSRTIIRGRYYSEAVQRDAPEIGEFMRSIGGGRVPRDQPPAVQPG
jgi:ketosteroid isomerase-like protein